MMYNLIIFLTLLLHEHFLFLHQNQFSFFFQTDVFRNFHPHSGGLFIISNNHEFLHSFILANEDAVI